MNKKRSEVGKPRYLQVCDDLVEMIRSGEVAVGAMLPTELELCERFDISRHTAREALRRVEDMGLVERRRGSGTRVLSRETPVAYNQFVTNLDELMQYGQATRLVFHYTAMDPVPEELAGLLDCDAGRTMLHMQGVRSYRDPDAGGSICFTDLWIPHPTPAQARALLDPERCERALYRLLDFSKLSRVRQTLSADSLAESAALRLEAKPDSAALVVHRSYFDRRNRRLVLAISVHPKERFRFSTELTAHGR